MYTLKHFFFVKLGVVVDRIFEEVIHIYEELVFIGYEICCGIYWSIINILNLIHSYYCHTRSVQTNAAIEFFHQFFKILLNHFVSVKLKMIGSRYFLWVCFLNFVVDFNYVFFSIQTTTEIKWIIPV